MKQIRILLSLNLALFFSYNVHSQVLTTKDVSCMDAVQVADLPPSFENCDEISNKLKPGENCLEWNVKRTIIENYKYPKDAEINGVKGVLKLTYLVNQTGGVENIRFDNSLTLGCEEEAIRLINLLPKFKPAILNGESVCYFMDLEIPFGPGNPMDTKVLKVAERMPQFPGCEEEVDKNSKRTCAQKRMLEFIYKNLNFPEAAEDANVRGTVVVSFIVEVDGEIVDVEVIRNIGYDCGAEAKRVVESMPNWIPGMQNGKLVRVQINLPIKFNKHY